LPIASGGQSFEFRYSAGSSGVAKTPLIVDYNDITALTNFKASGDIETSSNFIASGGIETGSDISFKGATGTKYIYFPDTGSHTGQLNMQAGFGSGLAGGALTMFGQNHATKAGSVNIGITAIGSKFTISDTAFGGGAELASVDRSGNGVFLGTVSAASYSGGAALTGTPTAPTAAVGTNTTQIATTAFTQTVARPYKVYTALLTQSGTSAPTAVVLENTLGGSVVWSWIGVGQYRATLVGAFPVDKVVCFITRQHVGTAQTYVLYSARNSDDVVNVLTRDTAALADGVMSGASFEIRVYN